VFHLIVFHFSSFWVKIGKQLYIMLDVINRGYGGANTLIGAKDWVDFQEIMHHHDFERRLYEFQTLKCNLVWCNFTFFILVNFRLNDFGVILKCFINHQRCRKQWVISYWLVHFKFKCLFFSSNAKLENLFILMIKSAKWVVNIVKFLNYFTYQCVWFKHVFNV